MKYIIAAAAVSVALSTSSHALTTNYDDGAAQFWASLAESTNNADDFVMFSWLADSAELKATDEAVQNALDVSDKINANDIPEAPDAVIDEATITATQKGTGFATVNTDHGFEGTYTKLDYDVGEVPEEITKWKAYGEYGISGLNDKSKVIGKIELNKERIKSGITSNIDYNYSDTIYVVEQVIVNPWDRRQVNFIYEYSHGVHPTDYAGDTAFPPYDPCEYQTCENNTVYYTGIHGYGQKNDGLVNGGMKGTYINKYDGWTFETLINHIADNPVEHVIHWNFWNTDNTFVITRNGKVIADAKHHGIWQSDDLDEMYEIIEEIAAEAYEEGFEDGYSEGYSDGYSDGFADGVNSVKDQLQ